MEISFNYGTRRYFISDNWFYILLFLFSVCVFLKQKRKKKRNMERKPGISSLDTRGGDNSVILQKFKDKCLSDNLYVEVKYSKVKQIIRKMLDIEPGKTIIISAPVYLLAMLQKNSAAPLVLERGGAKLIISNLRGFVSKGVGTVLFAKLIAIGSAPMVVASLPLILSALVYSGLHVDCNSFVSTLPTTDRNFQYMEAPINEDAKIIVSPQTPQTLYTAFDETEVSSISNIRCYVKDNCLGPEPIRRKVNSKPKRFIPLSERTKTLKDLKCPIDPIDEIDVTNVKYKNEKESGHL